MCRIGLPASGVGEWGLEAGSPGQCIKFQEQRPAQNEHRIKGAYIYSTVGQRVPTGARETARRGGNGITSWRTREPADGSEAKAKTSEPALRTSGTRTPSSVSSLGFYFHTRLCTSSLWVMRINSSLTDVRCCHHTFMGFGLVFEISDTRA